MKQLDHDRMTKSQKIEYVEKLLIYDPMFSELASMIEDSRERSVRSSAPRCLFMAGITGSGKTTLGKEILKKHPRCVGDEKTIVPVLMSKLFAPATVKNMATALLRSMGDPIPDKGTKTNQTIRLYDFLESSEVELIIIDEFQRVFDRNSNRVIIDGADWLTDLVDESELPVVLLGMPWGKHILDMHTQLKRRFSAQRELKPFGWDTDEKKKYIMKFLNSIDKKLPFSKRSELGSEEIAFRIMCGSRGKRSAVMRIVRRASELTIKCGGDQITMQMLAKAYDDELASLYPQAANPFFAKRNKLILDQIKPGDMEYQMPKKQKKSDKALDIF